MLFRIETGPREGQEDVVGEKIARRINKFLRLPVAEARVCKIYTIDGIDGAQANLLVDEAILFDPILQRAAIGPLQPLEPLPQWFCEVGYRPGVTDNEGRTARDTAAWCWMCRAKVFRSIHPGNTDFAMIRKILFREAMWKKFAGICSAIRLLNATGSRALRNGDAMAASSRLPQRCLANPGTRLRQ